MRALQPLVAGLALASALFLAIMLVAPPTSEAAGEGGVTAAVATPLVLVGP